MTSATPLPAPKDHWRKQNVAPQDLPVRAPAQPARMRPRHRILVLSFLLAVILPLVAATWYLWWVAEDRFASVTGFTVRAEETGTASELLGGLAQMAGTSTRAEGDILYEFIASQSLVQAIDQEVGLRDHYGASWKSDPVFSLWPDASIEDLVWFWQRILRVSYDQSSGVTEMRVLALTPEKAQDIAEAVLRHSQAMINDLNAKAREDAMRHARADLAEAERRLRDAREALTTFRTLEQIMDPESDIKARMGVLHNLQQVLADLLVQTDLLRATTRDDDPASNRRKIE